LGDDRIILPDLGMLAGGGHRDESAEIEPVGAAFDAGPGGIEGIDVDQYLGRITSSFVRSRRVVPPARYCAAAMVGGTRPPSWFAAAWTASARPPARW
jgi:hypothetical protein